MKQRLKILTVILILPPLIAELLSGSAPPQEFFRPFTLLFLVLLYGCGALLIREARTRWNMQWSILFLVAAYAIAEEGLTTKAFFNIDWPDVGVYAYYGTWHGILLPWSILLITFHSTISTLLPILITDLIWPKFSGRPLLKKRGLIITFIGFIFVVVFGLIFSGNVAEGVMKAFYPEPGLLILSFALIFVLILAGYGFRGSKICAENGLFGPRVFAVAAFLFNVAFIVVPFFLAEWAVSQLALVSYQLLLIIAALLFAYFQIYNAGITRHHFVNLVSGTVLFMGIFAVLQEFQGVTGMGLTGVLSIILLFIWRRRILVKSTSV